MKSAPTIAFDYRPSRGIGIAAGLICGCAVVAPWLTSFSIPLSVLIAVMVLAAGSFAVHRHGNPRFRRIAYRASGWTMVDARGEEHAALLESHARVGSLLALGFRYGPRARFRVVFANDNLDTDTHRRLILLLSRAEIVQAG